MKAAAVPVNFWLPASYHTPRVVASALFAGVLTKVGVYALLRTLVMLFPPERAELSFLIGLVAVATMAVGALGALAQSDLRRLLGYFVISGIGIMLSGLAIASPDALAGAIFYMTHSIIVMTALYIAAGVAARADGRSLSISTLAGFYRSNPLLSALTLLLFFSVSGLPPFTGLWPKIMLVEASFASGAGVARRSRARDRLPDDRRRRPGMGAGLLAPAFGARRARTSRSGLRRVLRLPIFRCCC